MSEHMALAHDDDDEPEAPPSAAETEVKAGLIYGHLADEVIGVPPTKTWRSTAITAIRSGDFELWAQKTLSEEDFEKWQDVDPTVEEIDKFFGEVNPGLGTGNSRASRRSSTRTPRR